MTEITKSLRILCVGETWFGSDARAAFAALQRLGHSVHIIDESHFVPIEWQSLRGRAIRKLFRRTMVGELTARIIQSMRIFRPDVLFVFKGNFVSPDVLRAARARGTLCFNYYPDVSFLTHGPEIPHALPLYDHVFNAKTFGIADMQKIGVRSISFLAPGFDPELHRPVTLTGQDSEHFGCDVSFIGTWSPKKEAILAKVRETAPDIRMRIWGYQWEQRQTKSLDDKTVMGVGIIGGDYARAICASSISLGLLSEARTGSSSGDLITARTFQIPACGTFMLHERNAEVATYFEEGRDAEFFSTPEELVKKVRAYIADPVARKRVAAAGLERSLSSDYSIDNRMRQAVSLMVDRLFPRTRAT